MPRVKLRRHGQVAQLREPAADVFDVLVHAEDFLDDQHHRKRFSGLRHGAVDRDVPIRGWYGDFACFETVGVSSDGLGGDRQNRHGESGRKLGYQKLAAIDAGCNLLHKGDFIAAGVNASRKTVLGKY